MLNKDELYDFLKKNKGIKFRVIHLAQLFSTDNKTINNKLSGMFKNKGVFYRGFDREQIKAIAHNSREYLCYVYFVK